MDVLWDFQVIVVRNWLLWLKEEIPKGLTVTLELGSKRLSNVSAWNDRAFQKFEEFDGQVVNKALKMIYGAS